VFKCRTAAAVQLKRRAYIASPSPHVSTIDGNVTNFCIGVTAGPPVQSGSPAVFTTKANCPEDVFTGSFSDATIKLQSPSLCLDVSGNSTSQNAAVIWYTCHGSTNQQWWNPVYPLKTS
jgi:hypothetical protein